MNKKLYIITVLILLIGCKQQSPYVSQKMNVDFFINRYYTINYEYPLSLDELLSFCKNDTSYMKSLHDSLLIDYSYIKQNSKKFSWILDDTNFPTQKLIVLYKKDTLVYQINDWRFPCIGFYNDAYVDCYLKEPESLDNFLSFCYYCDSLENGTNELYTQCNSITVKNLQRCKQLESFQWINSNDKLLIVIGDDTVWYHNNELLPCIDYLKPLFQPHYYDKAGQYVKLSEDIDGSFKNNLRKLWHSYYNQNRTTEYSYYTLVYSKTKGLYSFCEGDEKNTNTKYFKDIGNYLEEFADKFELGKIVFVVPKIE